MERIKGRTIEKKELQLQKKLSLAFNNSSNHDFNGYCALIQHPPKDISIQIYTHTYRQMYVQKFFCKKNFFFIFLIRSRINIILELNRSLLYLQSQLSPARQPTNQPTTEYVNPSTRWKCRFRKTAASSYLHFLEKLMKKHSSFFNVNENVTLI